MIIANTVLARVFGTKTVTKPIQETKFTNPIRKRNKRGAARGRDSSGSPQASPRTITKSPLGRPNKKTV